MAHPYKIQYVSTPLVDGISAAYVLLVSGVRAPLIIPMHTRSGIFEAYFRVEPPFAYENPLHYCIVLVNGTEVSIVNRGTLRKIKPLRVMIPEGIELLIEEACLLQA